MAELTHSHNISGTLIGLTPGSAPLTVGLTFSVDGVSFSSVIFDILISNATFDFSIPYTSIDDLRADNVSSEFVVANNSNGLVVSNTGTTWNHFIGITLFSPQSNVFNGGLANQILNQDLHYRSRNTFTLKYGAFGQTGSGAIGEVASSTRGETLSFRPFNIVSATNGVAGSTLGLTLESANIQRYYVGIGTGATFYGIVSLLGCTNNISLNSSNLTSTQISEINADYLDPNISGSDAKFNTLRRIVDTSGATIFNTSFTEFVVPKHIPTGSYYLMPIPNSFFGLPVFSSDEPLTNVSANLITLPQTNINITNNISSGLTGVYSLSSGVTHFTNPFSSRVPILSKGFSNVDFADKTLSVFDPITFNLVATPYGITNNLTGNTFHKLDYGFNTRGTTLYGGGAVSNISFIPPLFGFIPLGLTVGNTLTVLLDGVTFYEKVYNPYNIIFNTDTVAHFYTTDSQIATNKRFFRLINESGDLSARRNLNHINRAFYRVDFNTHSNPWGFTGFTFGQGSTQSELKVFYGNPANGISFILPINTGSPADFYSLTGDDVFIPIQGTASGSTLVPGNSVEIHYQNRPLGYLEKLNLYDASGNFALGITIADNRTFIPRNTTEIGFIRKTFDQSNIETFVVPNLNSVGSTGTARISFTRGDGISFEFGSTPITTPFRTFSPIHTVGNISGLTLIATGVTQQQGNPVNFTRFIAPAVDLMRITVNHGLTNLESGIVGRNNIHSRYYMQSNVDNFLPDGTFYTGYLSFIIDSVGPENVVNNSINVTNRTLRSFRESALERANTLNTINGISLSIPLRNFEGVITEGWPFDTIEGNSSLTQLMNYFNGPPLTEAQLSAVFDDFNYPQYDTGFTLMFDQGDNPPETFNGGEWVLANPGSFLRYSGGSTFFPSTAFSFADTTISFPHYIFYDYRITGVTLSSTSSIQAQQSLTTTITVKDLPHSSIFDGLRLSVLNGASELFTKNLLYSTSSTNDYRIPGYSGLGITNYAAYYTATPRAITSIFVGSGSTLGGITITPPTTGWPASATLTVRVSPIFKSFINITSDLDTLRTNSYVRETSFTTAAQTTTGGGGGGSSSGSVSVSESVVTGVAFTSTENDFYAGFLCGTTAYNIITNNSTASYSVLTSSSTAYANAKAAFDAGTLTANTSTDVEIHSLLNFMDYGGNIIVSPTIDGLLGSNYEYDIVFTEDNKRYGELMRIGSEKNHAIVIVGTSLEEDAASFAAPAYTNLNSAGLVDGLTYMTTANKGEYVFSVLGYKNRTRFYGSGTETVRLYLSSDVAGAYARSYVENKYHLSSSGSARGGIRTYSNITPTIVDRDLSGYYTRGINPIYIPSGTNRAAIWGDATGITTGNEVYRKSASVSKNTSTIKKEFKKIFEDFQFEQNNAGTRAQFVSRATTVLDKLQSVGGLASYTLICNETNNTPSVVAQKRLVVDLTIVPNNSIESIVLNFVLNQI